MREFPLADGDEGDEDEDGGEEVAGLGTGTRSLRKEAGKEEDRGTVEEVPAPAGFLRRSGSRE